MVAPNAQLQILNGTDVSLSSGGYLVLGSNGGQNIAIDDNEIMARNGGLVSGLHLQNNGGDFTVHNSISNTEFIILNNGDVGIGTTTPILAKLQVVGDIYASTHITAAGALGVGTAAPTTTGLIRATNDIVAFYSSDRRLKENIVNIPNALEKVSKLNGVTFNWKEFEANKDKSIHANEGSDVGVIAQEIEAVFPDLVETRDNGYKAVKYDKLVAVLIEAVKELKLEVEELKNK